MFLFLLSTTDCRELRLSISLHLIILRLLCPTLIMDILLHFISWICFSVLLFNIICRDCLHLYFLGILCLTFLIFTILYFISFLPLCFMSHWLSLYLSLSCVSLSHLLKPDKYTVYAFVFIPLLHLSVLHVPKQFKWSNWFNNILLHSTTPLPFILLSQRYHLPCCPPLLLLLSISLPSPSHTRLDNEHRSEGKYLQPWTVS